jgi:hypothetical protein
VILHPILSEFILNDYKQIKLNENIINSDLKTPNVLKKLSKSKSGKNVEKINYENKKNNNEFHLNPDKFINIKNNKTNKNDEMSTKLKKLKTAYEEDKY